MCVSFMVMVFGYRCGDSVTIYGVDRSLKGDGSVPCGSTHGKCKTCKYVAKVISLLEQQKLAISSQQVVALGRVHLQAAAGHVPGLARHLDTPV